MAELYEYPKNLFVMRTTYSVTVIRHINENVNIYYDSMPYKFYSEILGRVKKISITLSPAYRTEMYRKVTIFYCNMSIYLN
jgi:hypothetical protein